MNDEMERLADLLAKLIEKYVDKMDLENLPPPPPCPTAEDVVGIFLLRKLVINSIMYLDVIKCPNYKNGRIDMMKKKIKVYLYSRVSTIMQIDGFSVADFMSCHQTALMSCL